MTPADLSVELGDLRLANPVLVASGCGGTGRELAAYGDLADLGGFVTRSLTLNPRPGGPVPRIVETPSGLVNAVGLQNPGLEAFLATELPWLAQQGTRVVVSIAGATLGEYAELARRLGRSPGVSAIEVNLSSPDAAGHGVFEVREPLHAASVVGAVARDLPRGLPVLAKLRIGTAGIVDVARAAVKAGADAVVVGNPPRGLALDPVALRPALGGVTGDLSGPAVHPLALRSVWDLHEALPELPVVGVGGIRSGADVLAMLAVGACAVQVGSAIFTDPSAPRRILDELTAELAARGVTQLAQLIGCAHREGDQR